MAFFNLGDRNMVIRKNHPSLKKLRNLLDTSHNCGYVTFADIGVPDFGCPEHDPAVVRLGKSTKSPTVKPDPSNNNNKTTISNENFSFTGEKQKEEDRKLQSPDESHFALTPQASSPANGFTSKDCTDILKQELDQLDEEEVLRAKQEADKLELKLESTYSFDTLLSPLDETISMFSRDGESSVNESVEGEKEEEESTNEGEVSGE